MSRTARLIVATWLCALSAAAFAQTPSTCTAGLIDTSFGASGTGYVQTSPTLVGTQSAIDDEGLVFDSTGAAFALSEAAIDAGGNSVPTLLKIKRNGVRDLTFGGFGSVVPQQPALGAPDAVLDMDSAGNLLVAMDTADASAVVISRYSPAGVLDLTYGTAGVATIPVLGVTGPWAIRVAGDGSVFIASRGIPPPPAPGYSAPVVTKVTPAGALDTSFGVGGYSFFYNGAFGPRGKATDLVLQPNGTILVVGRVGDNAVYNYFFVARLLANGVLDTTFAGGAGFAIADFGQVLALGRRLAVQGDGKIVVVGAIGLTPGGAALDSGIARFTAAGVLDTTFNGTGTRRIVGGGGAFDVAIQNNGKLLITGAPLVDAAQTIARASVTRLTPSGQVDASFGPGGTVFLPVSGESQSGATNVSYVAGAKILVHVTGYDTPTSTLVENLVRLDSGSGPGCH